MSDDIATEDDIPPWHPWCGCAGCKMAAKVMRQIDRNVEATDE